MRIQVLYYDPEFGSFQTYGEFDKVMGAWHDAWNEHGDKVTDKPLAKALDVLALRIEASL